MKKILVTLLIIALPLIIYFGHTKGESASYFYDNRGMTLDYKNTDVDESHEIKMEANQFFEVSLTQVKGEIKLTIEDSSGTSIYIGNDLPTSKFEVGVPSNDTYIVKVIGKDVQGQLSVFRNE